MKSGTLTEMPGFPQVAVNAPVDITADFGNLDKDIIIVLLYATNAANLVQIGAAVQLQLFDQNNRLLDTRNFNTVAEFIVVITPNATWISTISLTPENNVAQGISSPQTPITKLRVTCQALGVGNQFNMEVLGRIST